MSNIIVTGANGFIGRHVLELLRTTNHQVYALSTKINNKETSNNVTWYEVNLLDTDSIKTVFKEMNEPTHLLHLAWDTTPGQYWNSSENLKWVQGSLSLFDHFCNAGGIRIVGIGTCAEYNLASGICYENQTPLDFSTVYGASKNALQHMLGSYRKTHQISTAWARLFYMYGPYEHPSRLVPSVICSLLQGNSINCTHGRQIRDYLYVKDVASALMALIEHDLSGTINIGSGIPYRLNEITDEIANMFNRPELVNLGAIKTPENEPPVILANVQMLVEQIGWKPSYHLRDGLYETIEWWREHSSF